jgi:DNA-binding NarL/FixJ family response regulator
MTARGLSNKEVARGLAIAPKTAELHRAHVMKKMDVHSAAELARIAIHLGEPDRAGDDSD